MSRVLAAFRCETCGGPVAREDLQVERGIAVCSLCHAVLVLEPPKPTAPAPEPLACPARFEVSPNRIVWRSTSIPPVVAFVFFAIWVSAWPRMTPYLVATGGALLYLALVGLVNRTSLSLDGEMVRVRCGPLPWRGGNDLHVSNIAHVLVVGGGVAAESTSGTRHVLVRGLTEQNDALYLAQELRRMLTAVTSGGAKPGSRHPTPP